MNAERLRIEDQVAQVESDLAELAEQVEDGEIDEGTAAELRASYHAEADVLRARLAGLEGAPVDDGGERSDVPPAGDRRRMLIGSAILVVGAIVIVAIAITSVNSSPSNAVAGVAAEDAAGLASVSNEEMEEVVAANPEIVGMRLALARRYFEAGDFDQAIGHYMIVLEQEQDPEALANVGWMTYLSDRPDVALGYLEQAIAIEPDFAQAYWFLANIRYTLGDSAGAIESLEQLLAFDAVPDEVRREAEDALSALREERP